MTSPNSTNPEYQFLVFLARLWRAKWQILFAGAVFAVVTYCALRFFCLETFRSEAVLMTPNERPSVPPPIWEPLLLSADTIHTVRTQFAAKFPKVKNLNNLDKFKKRFRVAQDIFEDTSVRRRYSPVVVLTADANTPEQARTLLSMWLDESMKRFGGITYNELIYQSEMEKKLIGELETEEAKLVQRQTELTVKSSELEKRVYYSMDVISPGQPPERPDRYVGSTQNRNSNEMSVQVRQGGVKIVDEGLIERRSRVEGELARSKAASKAILSAIPEPMRGGRESFESPAWKGVAEKALEMQASEAGAGAEIQAIDASMARLRGEIATDATALAKVKSELAEVESRLDVTRRNLQEARENLAQHLVQGYVSAADALKRDSTTSRLDLSIVSPPSLPDMRIAPKRLLSAALAGVAGMTLMILIMAFMHLIESLPPVARR